MKGKSFPLPSLKNLSVKRCFAKMCTISILASHTILEEGLKHCHSRGQSPSITTQKATNLSLSSVLITDTVTSDGHKNNRKSLVQYAFSGFGERVRGLEMVTAALRICCKLWFSSA